MPGAGGYDARMNQNQVRNLLDELCVKLGICLPPPALRRITNCPPPTVDRFTDVVMRAEGLNPIDVILRRQVRAVVAAHFDAAARAAEGETPPNEGWPKLPLEIPPQIV
jgi:hypothetical protein